MAIDAEFSGKEQEAKELYTQIVTQFAAAPAATTAKGAVTRIDCVGKVLPLVSKTITGEKFDLSAYRGKTVLLHYWATNSPVALTDLAALKDIQAKYARENVVVVGISLDDDRSRLTAFLTREELPWTTLFSDDAEATGWKHPLASRYGVMSIPRGVLIDRKGTVISLDAHGDALWDLLAKEIGPAEVKKPEAEKPAVEVKPEEKKQAAEPKPAAAR